MLILLLIKYPKIRRAHVFTISLSNSKIIVFGRFPRTIFNKLFRAFFSSESAWRKREKETKENIKVIKKKQKKTTRSFSRVYLRKSLCILSVYYISDVYVIRKKKKLRIHVWCVSPILKCNKYIST